MTCKSCGANIPDNSKFCPDCGEPNTAYVQPPQQQAPDYPNASQPDYNNQSLNNAPVNSNDMPIYTPSAPDKKPTGKVKATAKEILTRVIVSVVVIAIGTIASSIFYSNRKGSGDAPENAYEQVAVDYISNIMNTVDTNTFTDLCAIDFEAVYTDMVAYYSTLYSITAEDYYAGISESYGSTITNEAEMLNADLKLINEGWQDAIYEEFGSNTVNCSVDSVSELSEISLQTKITNINTTFVYFEKSLDDYIDTSAIEEAYEVKVEIVIDGSKVSTEYTNVDTFLTTVVKINGEYKVLFDDSAIDTLLSLMTSDSES